VPYVYLHAYYKGFALIQLAKFHEAIECCDEAVKLNPTNYDAYTYKIEALFKLNQVSEAFECMYEAVIVNQTDHRAYFNKESSLNESNKFLEAICPTLMRGLIIFAFYYLFSYIYLFYSGV